MCGSAEGSGQAKSMGKGQWCDVQQGLGPGPALGPQKHHMQHYRPVAA